MITKNKIGRRERSNKAGYLFVLPYALLFIIFILMPVLLAVVGIPFAAYEFSAQKMKKIVPIEA